MSDLLNTLANLPQGKEPHYALNKEAGWADPVWTFCRRKHFLALPAIKPSVVQSVAVMLLHTLAQFLLLRVAWPFKFALWLF
jgi:hypothetical protein